MADYVYNNRVKVVSTSTGTGAFTLGAKLSAQYQSFTDAGYVDGKTVHYVIKHLTSPEIEVGQGTYSAGTLLRNILVSMSSNGNALVNFSAGNKIVWVTDDLASVVRKDVPNTLSVPNGEVFVFDNQTAGAVDGSLSGFSFGAGQTYLLFGSNLKYDGSGNWDRYNAAKAATGFEAGQDSFSLIHLTAAGLSKVPINYNAGSSTVLIDDAHLVIGENAAPADGSIGTSQGAIFIQDTIGDAKPKFRIKDSAGTAVTRTPANLEQANVFTLVNPLTTPAESWIGPSSTAGIYFKNGNGGFGTTDPEEILHIVQSVSGSTKPRVILDGASDGRPQIDFKQAGILRGFYSVSSGAESGIPGSVLGDIIIRAQAQKIMVSADSGTSAHFVVATSGNVGIGIATPLAKVDVFGTLLLSGNSSTTHRERVSIETGATDNTDVTRKYLGKLYAWDTAKRECMEWEASGSAPMIGFLGATAALRQSHIADPAGGGTQDAEARTAINAILAALETFGFLATS